MSDATRAIRSLDLNADLGEGCPWDDGLLARVTSANVCCGGHAGDPAVIRRTLAEAGRRGVVVGAHPGYPDREGFGRVPQDLPAEAVEQLVIEQVETLRSLAAEAGVSVRYLKPHGALYNQAQVEAPIAGGVVRAAARLGLPLLVLPGSVVESVAGRAGLATFAEGFADRGYGPDGRLIPRGQVGAILDEPRAIAEQVRRLVDRGVASLCLHGDDPDATRRADVVREALSSIGLTLRPFLDG